MRSTATVVRRRRERRLEQNRNKSHRTTRAVVLLFTLVILALVLLLGGGVAAAVGIYIYYARDLPDPDSIVRARQQFETTLIYDRTGKLVLYQVLDPSGGDRQSVPLSVIPASLVNATIAIEDKSFFENPGFDIRGIIRAVWITLQGGTVQGGSTITQQLIKNILFAPQERTAITVDRKIREVILASEIARRYGKEQILEWYLNNNFYGNLAYGVDTASKVYFGKPVRDLTLGESAMLAAIPQNPQLNPLDAPQAARQRQIVVLDSMVALNLVTRQQADEAASQPIVIQPVTERYGIIAPHFSLYARRQAEQLLNAQGRDGARLVLQGGLRIYTTLDVDLQSQAECVMRGYVTRLQGGDPNAAPNTGEGKPCMAAQYLITPPKLKLNTPRPVSNAASLVLKPSTGEILSMVGSLDYWNTAIDGNYNAALGLRQPGSAFKPIVYVTAFASSRYTPATMVLDIPTTFTQGLAVPYTPKNDDDQFHGPVSVRDALANSYNIPTVRVLSDVGLGQVIRRAHQLGVNSLNGSLDQYGLALALGSGEVSLLDLTYSYSVFASMGAMAGTPVQNPRAGFRAVDPVSILRIEDKDGQILWQLDPNDRSTFGRQNLLEAPLAYLINNILSDKQARLPAFGPGNALELSRPAAAKTGTTNDNRDAWTIGYTPQLVTGVWIGNNNNSPMTPDVSGATAAAPIWRAIMEYYHQRDNLPVEDWKQPTTIQSVSVCKQSGLLPTADCPKVRELFYADAFSSTIPTQEDIYWKRYQINSRNGLIATAFTPRDLITERVYFDYPPEAREWAKSMGLPLPPVDYDPGDSRAAPSIAVITSPVGLARVRGVVEVKGAIESADVVSYNLAYGAGINPGQWISIGGSDPKLRGEDITLGRWDTKDLDGLYTLRLNIVLKDNTLQTYPVQVTVDNQPPTLRVTSPRPGATVGTGDQSVRLAVDAADNVEVAYVEFYHNDQLIDTVRAAPFELNWQIDERGPQTFYMLVYDTAGNSTRSDIIRLIVPRSP